jgi:hypothetical protein
MSHAGTALVCALFALTPGAALALTRDDYQPARSTAATEVGHGTDGVSPFTGQTLRMPERGLGRQGWSAARTRRTSVRAVRRIET